MSDALRVSVLCKGKELLSRTFARDCIVIGRDADCDIRINQPDVSRHHACIERRESYGYLLRDLGSSNGTFVDADAVSLFPIRDGARARITNFDLVFRIVDVPWENGDEPERATLGVEAEATLRTDGEEDPQAVVSTPTHKTSSQRRPWLGFLSSALPPRERPGPI